MRRELSTRFTWIYRWLIPGVLSVIALIALWRFLIGKDGQSDALSLVTGIAIAAAAICLARVFDRAKRVWIDGNQLIFAAYGKEYTKSMSDIVHVSETAYLRPHRIRLVFNTPTRFGTSIVFFPPVRFVEWLGEHTCTSELRRCLEPERKPD